MIQTQTSLDYLHFTLFKKQAQIKPAVHCNCADCINGH